MVLVAFCNWVFIQFPFYILGWSFVTFKNSKNSFGFNTLKEDPKVGYTGEIFSYRWQFLYLIKKCLTASTFWQFGHFRESFFIFYFFVLEEVGLLECVQF